MPNHASFDSNLKKIEIYEKNLEKKKNNNLNKEIGVEDLLMNTYKLSYNCFF